MHALWATRRKFVHCNIIRQPPLFRATQSLRPEQTAEAGRVRISNDLQAFTTADASESARICKRPPHHSRPCSPARRFYRPLFRLLLGLIFSPRRLFLLHCNIVLASPFPNELKIFAPSSPFPAASPSLAALVFSLIFTSS